MPYAKRSTLPWTITDGRAGNVRQAVALASALGLGGQQRLQLQPQAPWRWLSPRLLPGAARGFGAQFAQLAGNAPGLAIGCGRQAAGALRVLRQRGSRTVQILDPRIPPRHWDLLVVPEHDRLRADNVLTLLGSLNPVSDDWLAWGRAAFSSFEQLPGPRTALLVGGPTDHAPWQDDDIQPLFQQLAARIRAEGGSVTIGPYCTVAEAAVVGTPLNTAGDVLLDSWVSVETGADVQAKHVGEVTEVGIKTNIGAGATVGRFSRLTPTETVQAGERVGDFSVVFGGGQTRRDKTMEDSEDSRAQRVKAQEKHVEMLKRLIPDGKAKWLD